MAKRKYELKPETLSALHSLLALLVGEKDRVNEMVFVLNASTIEDFVPDGHPTERKFLRAILKIHEENMSVYGAYNPVEPTAERLGEMIGDKTWVEALLSKKPDDDNVRAASLVYQHVFEVERLRLAHEKNGAILSDPEGKSPIEVLRVMENNLAGANPNRIREQSLSEEDVYEVFAERQQEFHERIENHGISVLPFVWPTFQANMGGVPEGEPVIISTDDTGMGKTMLALDWEMFVAENFPYYVLHLTHETYAESIATRLFRRKFLIPQYAFKRVPYYNGHFYPIVNPRHAFWKPLFQSHALEVEERLKSSRLGTLHVRAILDPTTESVLDAIMDAYMEAQRRKLQLMIVDDYIQLWDTSNVGGSNHNLRDEQQRTIAARKVRALSKSLNASFIALSQTTFEGGKVTTKGARGIKEVFQVHVNMTTKEMKKNAPNELCAIPHIPGDETTHEPVYDFFGELRYMNSKKYSGLSAEIELAKANEGGLGLVQKLAIEYPMGRVYPIDDDGYYQPYSSQYNMVWLLEQHDPSDLDRWRRAK